MKTFRSEEYKISKLFKNGIKFQIPLYQREYKWAKEQIITLLEDVENFMKKMNENKDRVYFLGTIILKHNKLVPQEHETIVIDGQQRITSLFLIIKALEQIMKKNHEWKTEYPDKYNKLLYSFDELLFFTNENIMVESEKKQRLKLLHMENNEVFEKIMLDENNEIEKESLYGSGLNYWNNYKCVLEYLESKIKSFKDLVNWNFTILEELIFVVIFFGNDDEEHQVFENINFKGVSLSIDALIKNYFYILVDKYAKNDKNVEKQIKNFFDYDFSQHYKNNPKIQDAYEYDTSISLFKHYIEYLTLDSVPEDVKKLYKNFKKYVGEKIDSKEKLLNDLNFLIRIFCYHKYLDEFKDSKNIDIESDYDVCVYYMRDLLGGSLSLIFTNLAEKFGDCSKNKFTATENFKKCILILEKYRIRRIFSDKSEKNFNKASLEILKQIKDINTPGELEEILTNEDFSEHIDNKPWSMPSLDSFSHFLNKAKLKQNIKHILVRIDRHIRMKKSLSKEFIPIATYEKNYTIEHIMPKKIIGSSLDNLYYQNQLNKTGKNWEELHIEYLNTLGNLTLLHKSVNSSISNKAFASKKEIYNDSFLSLNEMIKNSEDWDIETIQKRTKYLVEIAKEIWK